MPVTTFDINTAQTCLSGITATGFGNGLGSGFSFPDDLSTIPLQLNIPASCQGVHVDFFPITIGFGFDGKPIPYCGAIDAETAAVDRTLVLDCPFTASDFPTGTPTYSVISFSMPTYQDGGTTGPNPKYQYSAITTGDANDLCEASLQITPPPDNLYYSKTDESYLSFEYTFDPVSCLDDTNPFQLAMIAYDPTNTNTATYNLVTPFSVPAGQPVAVAQTITKTQSLQDLRVPAVGQMADGQWEIELQTNPFQRNVLPAMAYFQVGHGLTPSGNSIASKRNLKARWETFALQGGKADNKVDAAFFSKNSADCPFTQCPVWGKPGVFECVDIQTNLESCGACQGDVCTDIPGAISMACVAGKCVVHECEDGLSPANNSTECL